MTTPETLTYREAAHLLLAQAQEELEAGDLRQASEKGWGATAQIVKAYAEHRGWPHRAHWMLNQAVENVVEETSDQGFLDLFNGAQGLHTNFYEMWLPPLTVRWNLNRVEQFIPRLDSLLRQTWRFPPESTPHVDARPEPTVWGSGQPRT